MSPYDQLPTDATGQWWIRTGTSFYRLELGGRPFDTIERLPSDDQLPDLHRADLRRDAAAVPLLTFLEPPTVGEALRCLILLRDDGVPTMRTTTAITEIGQLVNGDDHLAWSEITSEYTEGPGDGQAGVDPDLRRGRSSGGGDGVGGEP